MAYTSRALTDTEKNSYAQIKKETLAIVHCCRKFHHNIFGKEVVIESDQKNVAGDIQETHTCGTNAPTDDDATVTAIGPGCRLQTWKGHPHGRYAEPGKPSKLRTQHRPYQRKYDPVPHSVRQYWSVRDKLSVLEGIVYKGMRIVVPPSRRPEMLKQFHETHLGINKCEQRARKSQYWPGMGQQIEDIISDRVLCNTYQNNQPAETLPPNQTRTAPGRRLLVTYLSDKALIIIIVTVDYMSKFIEVDKLHAMSSASTIDTLKRQFSVHGLPEVLRSDNDPQYAPREFQEFCGKFNITHVTSSPAFLQSNGEAERAVQTVKRMWTKSSDKHMALLDYRTTPLESCGLLPAQLLMPRPYDIK